MNLSDLFGGGGGAAGRSFQTAVYTTAAASGAVTTQPCWFMGFDFPTYAAAASGDVTLRQASTTGTVIYYAATLSYNGGVGGHMFFGNGIYCPNGLYHSDMTLTSAYLNLFYALA